MTATNTFRWGLIGPGRIAERFAGGLAAIDDAELYAVASSNGTRAAAFAKKFSASQSYDSYQALLDDPNIDAVYIGTPHRFHFEQTRLCLEAGKPVLCEKPLTVNTDESEQLVELSRRNKVFLMEALWTRYLPIYDQVREWLDGGKIGEATLLSSTFGFNLPRDADDRWFNNELAGGALLDMGVYNVSVSQWVFGGNPTNIVSSGYVGETNVDEMTAVILNYGADRMSQFTTNFIAKSTNDFHIYGTKGYIRIHSMFWDTTEATLFDGSKETTVSRPFRATGFEYETEEAMRCIREGLLESPKISHADTLATMQVMDQIREQIGLRYNFE